MSFIGAGLLERPPAAATGILPPANPSANIPPDSSDWLTAINNGRAHEGVGPMNVSEATLGTLPVDEQVFTVINDERIDRGLPPIDYLTSQLDSYAQGGANAGTDPSFPSVVTGGAPITFGGSIWAGGLTSVLEADYYWMYDDGWGGTSTTNAACSASNPSGCWGHRDIILHAFPSCPTGAPVLSMGAASSPSGYAGGSIAAILVSSCSPPTDITASWGQVAATGRSPDRGPSASRRLSNGTGLLGGRGERHRGRLRLRAELRLAVRPAQLAHRRHGGHARTAAATGWWPPTAASSASVTPASTARRARCG